MAQDKTNNLTEFLKDLTSTIRTQRGWSGEINHQDISSKIQLQQKTATPSESTQTITPDSSIYGLKTVTVNAIPNDYVGSAIYKSGIEPDAKAITYFRANDSVPYYLYVYVPNYSTVDGYEKALITRGMKVHSENFGNAKQNQVLKGATFTSESGLKIAGTIETKTSLSKSGGTVTASAGYYASNVSSTVSVTDLGYTQATSLGGSLSGTTYTVSIDANKYTSSKLTKAVNPGTLGLTAKGGTTITPSTTEQTAIPANYYTTGDIKVSAIPSNYVNIDGYTTITDRDVISANNMYISDAGALYLYIDADAELGGYFVGAQVSELCVEYSINMSSTGTSASGTLISNINPSSSTQYVNITEGYTKAKYWKINSTTVVKTAGINYQPYKNIIKPTVTNCQYWSGQQSSVNGIFPLFYFNGVSEAFVGSKLIPNNTNCRIGHTTTASNSDYQTTEIYATYYNGAVYFGLSSSTVQLRVPHKGDEKGSSAGYGMTIEFLAPLIFIKKSNFSSTPVVTAVYKTWNRVNGITTVGGTYCGSVSLTENITANVSSNNFFYPGYISLFGLDGNDTLQINVDSNNGTLS